ncbi:MAG: hypothetical protein AAF495_21465 [Pseudomonadota bacterium]
MENNEVWLTIQEYFRVTVDTVQKVLPEIGPEYLMLIMAVLIWIQLGRIARALKHSGGVPADLPRRVQSLQQQVKSMSSEIADFQHYASQRRQAPVSERPSATYRESA